jgi:hypothetical protein
LLQVREQVRKQCYKCQGRDLKSEENLVARGSVVSVSRIYYVNYFLDHLEICWSKKIWFLLNNNVKSLPICNKIVTLLFYLHLLLPWRTFFLTSVFTVDNFKQSNVYSMFTLGTKEKWLHKTIDSLYIFCLDFGTVLMMWYYFFFHLIIYYILFPHIFSINVFIPPLDESQGYIGILMFIRPSVTLLVSG